MGARILSLSPYHWSLFASTVIRATMLNRFCKATIHSDCFALPLQLAGGGFASNVNRIAIAIV